MKACAFVLLCALAAVQGRYTSLQSTSSEAALGENPWVVHLRIATNSSGLLETCAGSLIDSSFVLTAASCVSNSRFIWVRYGVVNVISPTLVTENSVVRLDPTSTVAVINIGRIVQEDDIIGYINPIGELEESAKVCGFGENEDGTPGERLKCFEGEVSEEDGALTIKNDDFKASRFDFGAALVSGGDQVGILVDESGKFVPTADYIEWITSETGITFNPTSRL